MSATAIDKMREERRTPKAALTKYLTTRGKNPDKLICIFEGYEDPPYYETIFKRIAGSPEFCSVVAKGKDKVLGLRDLIRKREDEIHKIRFFVDKDFDHLKGHPPGDDLYITEGYSIENHLISREILISILQHEFKCIEEESSDFLEDILKTYDSMLESFNSIIGPVNEAIHYARKKGIALSDIEDRVTEYAVFSAGSVTASTNDFFELIGWPEAEPRDLSELASEFSSLDPSTDWRGKFIFGFFIKILNILKQDRTSNTPTLFPRKAGVKFDPNGEVIRAFAGISKIPASLNSFIKACPG